MKYSWKLLKDSKTFSRDDLSNLFSAPQMAYPKSHNPFADDDDDEDFKPKRREFDDDPSERGMSEAERKQRYLQQEVMRTAQSAVDSSYRSLGLIYESEKMGVETAEVCETNQLYPNTQSILLSLRK